MYKRQILFINSQSIFSPAQLFKMDWLLMSIILLCIMAMGLYALINVVEDVYKRQIKHRDPEIAG